MSGRIEQEIGTKWAGRLPDSWGVFKLKYLASIRNSSVDKKSEEGETPIRLCNYVDVYYNDRITADLDFMEATASQAEIARFRLRRGDVIITKDSESPDDIAVPAYVTRDFNDVLCGYHLALLRPDPSRVDGRFLAYCFRALDVNLQFQVGANGITRYGLSLDVLGNALIPVPPIDVQWAIADFLDRKTAAIDEVIRKKERLIELLEEKRQAVITQAVTKGLDASVPMKDSGVEWLGEVPAHWEVTRLKFLASQPLMYGANEPADIDDPTLPRYVRITDVNPDGTLREDTFRSLPEHLAQPYLLDEGDILFARSGATVGKAIAYRREWGRACFAGYMIRFRPNPSKIIPEFASYYTLSLPYFAEVQLAAVQATIQNVSAERYGNFVVPVPPLVKQEAIVAFLNGKTAGLDRTARALLVQIDSLREYRQTLISHAVTGKIDVREAVPA